MTKTEELTILFSPNLKIVVRPRADQWYWKAVLGKYTGEGWEDSREKAEAEVIDWLAQRNVSNEALEKIGLVLDHDYHMKTVKDLVPSTTLSMFAGIDL